MNIMEGCPVIKPVVADTFFSVPSSITRARKRKGRDKEGLENVLRAHIVHGLRTRVELRSNLKEEAGRKVDDRSNSKTLEEAAWEVAYAVESLAHPSMAYLYPLIMIIPIRYHEAEISGENFNLKAWELLKMCKNNCKHDLSSRLLPQIKGFDDLCTKDHDVESNHCFSLLS
ncbi:hypothetical protein HAX54_023373 [Datura stramonium]|uniref:Uncharacterized protein n=1 Tax=Datura stramonium TaxID=4076 RepID=A0ABS8S4T8_DATST|nr:hypothetical protein [Datura stramonium]